MFSLRKLAPAVIGALSLAILFPANSHGSPPPNSPLPPYDSNWPTLALRVNFRNLVGPHQDGKLPETVMASLLSAANRIWSQCAIQFMPRSFSNVGASDLQVPYSPQGQADLNRISRAMDPDGYHGAIPVTIAGPWTFYDPDFRLYLNGLGWVFTSSKGVERIGAMMSALKVADPEGVAILAHELGHAFLLPHSPLKDNLMGASEANRLSFEQCGQARRFAEDSLREFFNSY